jgi:hypothetical protein
MGGTGSKKDAFNLYGEENNLGNRYASQALGINSALAPALTAEAINPQGINPTTMGQMTTAAEQTAGGSNAGIAGTAGLRAARTRNIGSGQAATEEAGRGAAEDLSQINAGIQTKNADLKAHQQQAGLSGLGAMYGTDVNAGENALGLANSAVDIAGKQKPGFWQNFGQTYAMDWLSNMMNPSAAASMGG